MNAPRDWSRTHPGLLQLLLRLSNDTCIDEFKYLDWMRDNRDALAEAFCSTAWPEDYFGVWAREEYRAALMAHPERVGVRS